MQVVSTTEIRKGLLYMHAAICRGMAAAITDARHADAFSLTSEVTEHEMQIEGLSRQTALFSAASIRGRVAQHSICLESMTETCRSSAFFLAARLDAPKLVARSYINRAS